MKLLFDANLSWRLVGTVKRRFPGSSHVAKEGLGKASDKEIWDFAREEGFSIVSKDHDFRQLSFLFGPPPKVVILSVGNLSTDGLARIIEKQLQSIADFAGTDEAVLVIQAR